MFRFSKCCVEDRKKSYLVALPQSKMLYPKIILLMNFLFTYFAGSYAFMGARIIEEVLGELMEVGLMSAKEMVLAGSRYSS